METTEQTDYEPGLRRAIVARLMIYLVPAIFGAAIGAVATFAKQLGIGIWDVLRGEVILPAWTLAAISAAVGSLLIQSSPSPARERMEVGVALGGITFLVALGTVLALRPFFF